MCAIRKTTSPPLTQTLHGTGKKKTTTARARTQDIPLRRRTLFQLSCKKLLENENCVCCVVYCTNLQLHAAYIKSSFEIVNLEAEKWLLVLVNLEEKGGVRGRERSLSKPHITLL